MSYVADPIRPYWEPLHKDRKPQHKVIQINGNLYKTSWALVKDQK